MRQATTTHKLIDLVEGFSGFIKSTYGRDVPDWIMTRLKELAEIDPNSTAFRYGWNYDKSTRSHVRVPGEIYVNLHRLQEAMVALNAALTGTVPEVARWNVEEIARESDGV